MGVILLLEHVGGICESTTLKDYVFLVYISEVVVVVSAGRGVGTVALWWLYGQLRWTKELRV